MGLESARFLAREADVRKGVGRRVTVKSPAAGADWSIAVPGGVYWRILTVQATLITSAVAANRVPVLTISDGNQSYVTAEPPGNQAASTTFVYQWWMNMAGSYSGVSGTRPVIGLPTLALEQNSLLTIATTNKDVADQWSSIILNVEEFWFTDTELAELVEERQEYEREWAAQMATAAGTPSGAPVPAA